MKPFDIGPLNSRCRIEYKSVVQDATYGAAVTVWSLLAVAWCGVQDVMPSRTSSETVNQGMEVARSRTRIRMGYRTDIDSSMRLVIDRSTNGAPTVYQIIGGPSELGNRAGIELMVEKVST